jgi:YcxB-like protein
MARAMVISAGLVILCGIALAKAGTPLWVVVACFAYGVFLFLYYGVYAKARLRPVFRKAKNLQGEKTVELDEEQFKMSGADGESRVFWHAFSGYLETDNLFILTGDSGLAHLLPKRALSASDLVAVRRLLAEKIRPRGRT